MRVPSFAGTAALLLVGSFMLLSASSRGGTAAVPMKQAGAKAAPAAKRLSDQQIRKILIDESIAAYAGNCPCPYNTASNGSRCGKRSAWSRAGGAEPLCYLSDVSSERVQEYRNAHASPDT